MFRSRFSDAFPKSLPHYGPQDIENGVLGSIPDEQVERLLCALLGLVLNRKKDIEWVNPNPPLQPRCVSSQQRESWARIQAEHSVCESQERPLHTRSGRVNSNPCVSMAISMAGQKSPAWWGKLQQDDPRGTSMEHKYIYWRLSRLQPLCSSRFSKHSFYGH